MYLSKPENHIALAMTSLICTIIIGWGVWVGLSGLFDSEPQSLKWYAGLLGSGLGILLFLCGIAGFVLNVVAFAKVKSGQEKGQHSSHWP
ncbi:MAG: hypothetical protein Roseis2KO_18240 [Roseivirga sp.]